MATRNVYMADRDVELWEWLAGLAEQEGHGVSFMLARAIEALRREREAAS